MVCVFDFVIVKIQNNKIEKKPKQMPTTETRVNGADLVAMVENETSSLEVIVVNVVQVIHCNNSMDLNIRVNKSKDQLMTLKAEITTKKNQEVLEVPKKNHLVTGQEVVTSK